MRKAIQTATMAAAFALLAGSAYANEELANLAKDPKQWVMQAGDFANTRWSNLNQINKDNVGQLQVAWTFSTGVLRGHEGGPLIIGDGCVVESGAVLDTIRMPAGIGVSGLESDGADRFFCGGGNSGKIRAVARPR